MNGMDDMIARFPAQLTEALEIGEAASIKAHDKTIQNVFVAGLGGSGIGAELVADMIRDECKVPFLIGKGYDAPAYIDEHTLFIASSYSGNTEETLSCTDEIKGSGAKVVVITSGGKLKALAEQEGYDLILLPNYWPSPRACVGFSCVQQIYILYKLGLITKVTINNLKTSIDLIKYDQEEIRSKAEKIANILYGKLPIIYTTDRMGSVALRFKQQLNENAKIHSWYHVVPEMNHNELVAWCSKNNQIAVVFFRNKDDHKRNIMRIDVCKGILAKCTDTIIEIYSKGQSLAEKSIYFVHLGDWISWYLAQLRGVDAVEIGVIDHLKKELAKV